MLIASNRHTRADLELWREYVEADMLHPVNVSAVADIISEFAKDECYCSVSWGKDSVVVAAIVAEVAPHVPLVWVRPVGGECPGCEDVRDAFLSRFQIQYHEPACAIEKWNDETVTNEEAFRPAAVAVGTTRRITGIRSAESRSRKLSLAVHGPATRNTCRPLAWMSTQDIFAVMAQWDLPTHPNYAMLGGGRYEREWLRVDSLGGFAGTGHGRREWEQEYYGDVLARMAKRA